MILICSWIKIDLIELLVSSNLKCWFSVHVLYKAGCLPLNQFLKQRCFHCMVWMVYVTHYRLNAWCIVFIYFIFLVLVLDQSNTKAP